MVISLTAMTSIMCGTILIIPCTPVIIILVTQNIAAIDIISVFAVKINSSIVRSILVPAS